MPARRKRRAPPPGTAESAGPPPLGIISALPEELRPLVKLVVAPRHVSLQRQHFLVGELSSIPVVVTSTGEGARRAREGIRQLLSSFPVSRLLVLGISGAVSPTLTMGDIVVSRAILRWLPSQDHFCEPALRPDPRWLAAALEVERASSGTLLSVPRILTTSAEKRLAWGKLEKQGVAAVDLESWTYAEAAIECGIPFLAARSICDTASEDLPEFFNTCTNPDASMNRRKVVSHALRHPSTWPTLLKLKRRVHFCAHRLSGFTSVLLREGRSP